MIKLRCPRCNRDMALTDEHRGQYAFCKHCDGRVWVPAELTPANEKASSTEAVQPPPKVAPLVPATEQQGTQSHHSSRAAINQDNRTLTAPPPASTTDKSGDPPKDNNGNRTSQKLENPVDPPKQTTGHSSRHHATLITAEPAKSALAATSDGQLPALTLQTNDSNETSENPPVESNRWVILGVVCGSLLFSSILLIYEGSPSVESKSETKRQILLRIQEKYFGPENGPWLRYQSYLRNAALARSQGDAEEEERYYRKVLHLLNAQHLDKTDQGVTGLRKETSDRSLKSDEELMGLLSALLNNNMN